MGEKHSPDQPKPARASNTHTRTRTHTYTGAAHTGSPPLFKGNVSDKAQDVDGQGWCYPQATIASDHAVPAGLFLRPPLYTTPQVAHPPAGFGTPGCPPARCARLSPSSWTSPPRPARNSFDCSAPWRKSPVNSRSWRASARCRATPGGQQGLVRRDEPGGEGAGTWLTGPGA